MLSGALGVGTVGIGAAGLGTLGHRDSWVERKKGRA
jgi:hypothetical protein